MGTLAVPLPCRLSSLIGYAGAGRQGRDPSSQKGLGGAPEGEWLPSNGAVARRVPGSERGRSCEAAAHPPRAPESGSPPPAPKPSRGREEAASGLVPGKRGLGCGGPRAGLDPSPWPEERPGASPSPGLCAGRRRPLCPCGEWRTRQSPTATATAASKAFGEFKEYQRRFWGVPGFQPPEKTRGWLFRSHTADPRQFPPPCVPYRNLEPH